MLALSRACVHTSAGYTGVQPRPEQVRGTPDHTQRSVKPSDPDLLNTHCRLIPSYAGAAAATATHMHSPTAVPKLNLAGVSAKKAHAGMCQQLAGCLAQHFMHASLPHICARNSIPLSTYFVTAVVSRLLLNSSTRAAALLYLLCVQLCIAVKCSSQSDSL